MIPAKRRPLSMLVFLGVLMGLTLTPAVAQAGSAPAFDLKLSVSPTNLVPAGSVFSENDGLLLTAINVGAAATDGTPLTATVNLPARITARSAKMNIGGGEAKDLPGTCTGVQTVTCTTEPGAVLYPGQDMAVSIELSVAGRVADPSTLPSQASIAGGGAIARQLSRDLHVTAAPSPLDFDEGSAGLSSYAIDGAGNAVDGAGAHPFQFGVQLGFTDEPGLPIGQMPLFNYLVADGGVRDAITTFPPGLVVNPGSTPTLCEEAQLESASCPDSSQIGTITVEAPISGLPQPLPNALFNMVPPPGTAAAFGFEAIGLKIYPHIFGGVHAGDYQLLGTASNLLALGTFPIVGTNIQLWGDPTDPAHDWARGICAYRAATTTPCGPVIPQSDVPALSMPTSCTAASLPLRASIDSWGHPGEFVERSTEVGDLNRSPIAVNGCAALGAGFKPTLKARPTTNVADSPSGLDVDLHIPQTNDLSQLATAHLKKAVVTLPVGLALNPSSANGLAGCSSTQIGIDPSTGVADGNEPTCPAASRIGDVEVDTPLLGHALPGSVYLASPHDNPFDSLLAIYIVVEDPQSGILIKLAGHVEADPSTGRLTTTFDRNPQLPFSDFKLKFFGGSGGVLRSPAVCGVYSTTSSLTPWSAPESGPPATPSDSYAISSSCATSDGAEPNSPEFEAGALSPIAGRYTPFVVHLRREDGSQQFKTLTLTPPPGLTAKLAGTPACSDGALAAAEGKSGRDEQSNPSCPADSRIGTVQVGVGAGPSPYYAQGAAYLAGPYKGAPLSMAVITPATAGPYDLGTVVTRVALHVDPATAQITADADPLPSILEGIPLDVRSIDVSLDKPDFSRTGTSCDPMAVGGLLTSTLGQNASLESRYQLGNCANLAFKPHMTLKLKGATKRAGHPKLIATVFSQGVGAAGLSRVQVKLPRSAFLDQAHIRTVCTRVQFAAGAGNGSACPKGSIYGSAQVKTPLFDYVLPGTVFLRSSNHKLPDLVVALQGPAKQPIAVELDGKTDSVKGALRNTFEAVPDQPFDEARVVLFGGKRGLVVNSKNLCSQSKRASRANVRLNAQSGKVDQLHPLVRNSCRKAKHKRHKHHRRKQHRSRR